MSALTIIQEACRELAISIPNAAVTSNDQQVIQLLALLNTEGKSLTARPAEGWQAQQLEATFTTVATEIQTSLVAIAPNLKYIIDDTIWNRTNRRPIYGPLSPQQWQNRKGWFAVGPYSQFRVAGGNIEFSPVPSAGESCYFEYVTKAWTASGAESFASDGDTSLLDEELLKLGLIWRWKAAKGFDYAEAKVEYEDRVSQAIARDTPKSKLNLSKRQTGLPPLTVQESNFGSI